LVQSYHQPQSVPALKGFDPGPRRGLLELSERSLLQESVPARIHVSARYPSNYRTAFRQDSLRKLMAGINPVNIHRDLLLVIRVALRGYEQNTMINKKKPAM
jgi:hypothetical protein